eukprot:741588-Pleurochrysis_carterae.AAC.2
MHCHAIRRSPTAIAGAFESRLDARMGQEGKHSVCARREGSSGRFGSSQPPSFFSRTAHCAAHSRANSLFSSSKAMGSCVSVGAPTGTAMTANDSQGLRAADSATRAVCA